MATMLNISSEHLPLIRTQSAQCSCGHWDGAFRLIKEPQGVFTERVYLMHREHVAKVTGSTAEQKPLLDTQGDLFSNE